MNVWSLSLLLDWEVGKFCHETHVFCSFQHWYHGNEEFWRLSDYVLSKQMHFICMPQYAQTWLNFIMPCHIILCFLPGLTPAAAAVCVWSRLIGVTQVQKGIASLDCVLLLTPAPRVIKINRIGLLTHCACCMKISELPGRPIRAVWNFNSFFSEIINISGRVKH